VAPLPAALSLFFDVYSAPLMPQILRLNAPLGVPLEFVEAPHPCVEQFHTVRSFDSIAAAQRRLGQTPIKWLITEGTVLPTAPAAPVAAAASSSSSAPAVVAAAAKQASATESAALPAAAATAAAMPAALRKTGRPIVDDDDTEEEANVASGKVNADEEAPLVRRSEANSHA